MTLLEEVKESLDSLAKIPLSKGYDVPREALTVDVLDGLIKIVEAQQKVIDSLSAPKTNV